ncbi:alkaline phosphatase-like [Galendromus occidentalis]|uniref:alkaline phosphatase n=1 Tax=Galendromus occidentalis TaxID=34638 RepID=A0AAJ7SEX8_9ACAR|nr:alkaline phosphatase-like [Galendromus occidentalis]
MGVSTVTAGRIYKGQRRGASGEEAVLDFEKFPFTALSKTYSVDKQTPDSAATGTAYLCGVKTNNGVLGVTAKVKRGDCAAASRRENQVESLLAWAQAHGKWTGLVTTDSVTGASAAATYAHSADRTYTSSVPNGCHAKDIAEQLIHGDTGSRLKVIFGGGLSEFLPEKTRPKEQRMIEGDGLPINARGNRKDGRNLIEEYLQRHTEEDTRAAFVWTRDHLEQLEDPRYSADFLLGLFAPQRLSFALDNLYGSNDSLSSEEPSLAEMTLAAIKALSKAPRGFVLFIEAGNIDQAHHDNLAAHALEEVYQLDKAVRISTKLLSPKNTLFLVTADHSHPFTVNGYAARGKNVLGKTEKNGHNILSYASGPGGSAPARKMNRNLYPSMVNLTTGVHSAEDVPVFAVGPWAHLFTGSVEQSYLPHALSYAACIGPYSHRCAKNDLPQKTSVNVNYIKDRMERPTEKPFFTEVPVPHRVNILAPNQIEFTKVQTTAPVTTVRPTAKSSFGTTFPDSAVTHSQRYVQVPHTRPKESRKNPVNDAGDAHEPHRVASQERSTAKDFRKQISQRRKKGKNVVAASEIDAEIMPSSFINIKPESRMDDGPIEEVQDARPAANTQKQRKVVRLYVPRNGKFSNGFEKRAGMMTNYQIQTSEERPS